MTHKLLLDTNWSTRFVQKRTVRVSEGVPAKSRDADLFTFRLENLPLDHAGAETTTRDGRGEHQPLRAVTFPSQQDIGEDGAQGHFSVGRLGLHFSDSPVNDSLLNHH